MESSSRFRFDHKMNYDFHPRPPGRGNLGAALLDIEQAELILPVLDQAFTFLFTHALVQDTAYSMLLKQERKSVHRQVAETLQRVYADQLDNYAALLAQHFTEAGDDAKTIEYGIRAGDVAMRLYALTEARVHYTHALGALVRLPDNDENARMRMETLGKLVSVSRFAEEPSRNLARLDEAEAVAKRLLESDQSIKGQLAQIYHWKGFVNLIRNQSGEALHYFSESGALARALGDDELEAETYVHAAAVLNFQGRFGEAERLLRDSINLMSKREIPVGGLYTFAQLGLSLANQGFYAEGLAEAQRGLTMALEANHTGGLETCYSILVQIYRLGNDIPRMLEASRAVVETAQAVRDIVFVCSGSFFLAWAQSYLGQHQAAFESIARARDIVEMLKGQLPSRELYAAVEAEVALNAGQAKEALTLAEQAVNLANSAESIFTQGLARRIWGQALAQTEPDSWAKAETHLKESLLLFEEGNARLEAARAHLVWGKLLQSRGNRDAGHEHLEKAAAQYQTSRLNSELEQAQLLIQSLSS